MRHQEADRYRFADMVYWESGGMHVLSHHKKLSRLQGTMLKQLTRHWFARNSTCVLFRLGGGRILVTSPLHIHLINKINQVVKTRRCASRDRPLRTVYLSYDDDGIPGSRHPASTARRSNTWTERESQAVADERHRCSHAVGNKGFQDATV